MPIFSPVTVPMQTDVCMLPQVGMGGILILMILATIILFIPIILFFIMLYKAKRNFIVWREIFTSDDFKGILEEQQKTSKRFINNLNDMMETWIYSYRKKEKK